MTDTTMTGRNENRWDKYLDLFGDKCWECKRRFEGRCSMDHHDLRFCGYFQPMSEEEKERDFVHIFFGDQLH